MYSHAKAGHLARPFSRALVGQISASAIARSENDRKSDLFLCKNMCAIRYLMWTIVSFEAVRLTRDAGRQVACPEM
jgi:hypothetical protein